MPTDIYAEPTWTRVWVDPAKKRIILVRKGEGHWRQWIYLLHSGQMTAPLSRGFLTLGGLGPGLLAVTGLRRWYRQRRRYGLSAVQNPV